MGDSPHDANQDGDDRSYSCVQIGSQEAGVYTPSIACKKVVVELKKRFGEYLAVFTFLSRLLYHVVLSYVLWASYLCSGSIICIFLAGNKIGRVGFLLVREKRKRLDVCRKKDAV